MSFRSLQPGTYFAAVALSIANLLIPSTGSAQFFNHLFEGEPPPPRRGQVRPQPRPQYVNPNWGGSIMHPNGYQMEEEDDYGNYGYGRPEPRRQVRPQPQPQPGRGRPMQLNPYSYDDDERDTWTAPSQFPWFNPNPRYGTGPEEGEADKTKRELVDFRNQQRQHQPFFVTQPEWTEEHERIFGLFVAQLGRAVRAKKYTYLREYMQDPAANAYAHTDPHGVIYYADCADFPYFLRAYFAFKNQLPMSAVAQVAVSGKPYASLPDRDADLEKSRLDNSPYGNLIQARGNVNVPRKIGGEINFINYLVRLFDTVSTRTFRVGPLSPNYSMSDVYPVKIDSHGIRPGTIVHSTGHLLVVFEVDKKGVVHAIDAHPDGSVSYQIIKPSTLQRSRPDQGLGFFKFRPLKLVNYTKGRNTALYGGKIVAATDEELYAKGLYSLDQWYGAGSNIAPGTAVSPTQYQGTFKKPGFFDYVASQLRDRNFVTTPEDEVESLLSSLCDEMQQRMKDVDTALTAKGNNMNLKPHPSELPQNIWSTSGDWEDFSSPGRDGRMKASVYDIARSAVSKFKLAKSGADPGIRFNGSVTEYQTVIRAKLKAMDQKCPISYTKSNGQKQALTFNGVVNRLNKMSFDPYHCAEKRWGASGNEMKTCKDTDTGSAWYNAQQFMRNTVGKSPGGEKYVIRSDRPITLQMLQDQRLVDMPDTSAVNLGTKKLPMMNLDGYFASEEFIKALQSN